MESGAKRPCRTLPTGRHNQRLRARKHPFAQACGRTLFVDESRTGAVAAFAVNEGNLTQLGSPTSLPAGATPAGIVVS